MRNEKVKVLRAMRPLTLDDVVLGQYEGYTFDPDVPDDSKTETYAMATMRIDNQRWSGVPFIVKCGKAVNERKCEIRVQFEENPLPYHKGSNRNEFVLRVQPDEAMYLKTNMKKVGQTGLVTAELDLSYNKRFPDAYVPEAYEKLIYVRVRVCSRSTVVVVLVLVLPLPPPPPLLLLLLPPPPPPPLPLLLLLLLLLSGSARSLSHCKSHSMVRVCRIALPVSTQISSATTSCASRGSCLTVFSTRCTPQQYPSQTHD